MDVADEDRRVAPPDKLNVAYGCYLLMGLGLLMPWNSFITAVDYFFELYPGRRVDATIAVAYNVPNLVAMISVLPFSNGVASRTRILAGYSLFFFATLSIPAVDWLVLGGREQGTPGTWTWMLIVAATVGLADGVAQSSLFGEAGCLPGKYTQAVCSGTSFSGLAVSLLRVVTKAAIPGALRASAHVYFVIAALVAAVCIFVEWSVIPVQPIVRFFTQARGPGRGDDDPELSDQGGGRSDPTTEGLELTQQQREPQGGLEPPPEQLEDLRLLEAPPSSLASPNQADRAGGSWRRHTAVLQHMKFEAAALVVIYWVTLAIFPGFIADGIHSEWLQDWYPILLITAYNAGDVVGKVMPFALFLTARPVLVLAFVRTAFVPVFYAVAAANAPPLVVGLLTFALGSTNGHLTACAMMTAPRGLPKAQAEVAGMLSALCLVFGIVLGSCTGLLWQV